MRPRQFTILSDSGKAAPFYLSKIMVEFKVEFVKLHEDDLSEDLVELVITQVDETDRIVFKNPHIFELFCDFIRLESWNNC